MSSSPYGPPFPPRTGSGGPQGVPPYIPGAVSGPPAPQSTPYVSGAPAYPASPQAPAYPQPPQGTPYGNNPQGTPYGSNPQSAPYGTGPQASPPPGAPGSWAPMVTQPPAQPLGLFPAPRPGEPGYAPPRPPYTPPAFSPRPSAQAQPQPAAAPPPAPGTQPIGRKQEKQVSIDEYKPKRSVGPLIALGVILLSTLIAVAGYFATRDTPGTGPSPSAPPVSGSATPKPGMPFESTYAKATGRWEILNTSWQSDRVVLTVRVTLDAGAVGYTFYAYDSAGSKVVDPETTSPEPALKPGRLTAGQTVEGTVSFRLPRGNGTLILADSNERPLSGLPIKG